MVQLLPVSALIVSERTVDLASGAGCSPNGWATRLTEGMVMSVGSAASPPGVRRAASKPVGNELASGRHYVFAVSFHGSLRAEPSSKRDAIFA